MPVATHLASFFRVTAEDYEKLHFSESDALTATLFIWGICIGIVLAALYTLYQQKALGGAVRAILRAEAFSEECAKTVEELGLPPRSLARRALTRAGALRSVVCTVQGEDGDTRYYIPEERKYAADLRFDKRENNVAGVVLTVVLAVGLALLLIRFFPMILGMINGLLS